MTYSEAIKLMTEAQEKTINRQPLTQLEEKAQQIHFAYGLVNGAKQLTKTTTVPN